MKNLSPNVLKKICFLFGDDIANSLSPKIHNAWFEKASFNSSYLPCQIQSEKDFLFTVESLLKVDNFLGANITKPFKNAILKLPNISYSSSVLSIGAANTLYQNSENKWCLANTDIVGIQKTIEGLMPIEKSYDLIVLGGGGASASCLYYSEFLSSFCQRIFCVTRSSKKIMDRFPAISKYEKLQVFQDVKLSDSLKIELSKQKNRSVLIANTLPSNGSTNVIVIDFLKQFLELMPVENLFYFDLNYHVNLTQNYAKESGLVYVNGFKMLQEQAKESFFLWTNIRPILNQY